MFVEQVARHSTFDFDVRSIQRPIETLNAESPRADGLLMRLHILVEASAIDVACTPSGRPGVPVPISKYLELPIEPDALHFAQGAC